MNTTAHDSQTRYGARPGDSRYDEVVVADEVERDDAVPQIARLASVAAGAVVAIIGLLALLGVDWEAAEVDRPVHEAAGMTFTPIMAVLTAVVGVLLILVGAARSGEGKIAMGAIVASLGAAILLVGDLENRWQVSDSQGWLALVVGLVFVVAGILAERRHVVRRQGRAHHTEVR